MSTPAIILLVGIAFLAIASVAALVHALIHAEEGFEDSTGFHRHNPQRADLGGTVNPVSPTVDTGNPWDQIEGATCPADLGRFRPIGPGDFSAHQS